MQATAKLSDYRQAPRKVRLIAGLIRGKSVAHALVELEHRAKRAAPVFVKLIKSAVANAKAQGFPLDTMIIKEIRVDKGAVLKRSRPRAQGRAFPIHKHTSHIMLTIAPKAEGKEKKGAATEVKPESKAKPVAKKVVAKKASKK